VAGSRPQHREATWRRRWLSRMVAPKRPQRQLVEEALAAFLRRQARKR
jgi:hypothetical protein